MPSRAPSGRLPRPAIPMTHECLACPECPACPAHDAPAPPPSPGTVGATPWQRPDVDRPEAISHRSPPWGDTTTPTPPASINHTYTTHIPHTYRCTPPPPSAGHQTGTGEEGQLVDNLRRRESRRSISTTKGIPLPPRRNPLMRPSRCWTPL